MKYCFLPVSNGIGDILAIPIVVVRDEGEGTRLIQVDEDGSRHKACPMKCEPFCPMIIFRMSFVLVFLRPKGSFVSCSPQARPFVGGRKLRIQRIVSQEASLAERSRRDGELKKYITCYQFASISPCTPRCVFASGRLPRLPFGQGMEVARCQFQKHGPAHPHRRQMERDRNARSSSTQALGRNLRRAGIDD